jgi:hypothetical protein
VPALNLVQLKEFAGVATYAINVLVLFFAERQDYMLRKPKEAVV